MREKQTMTKEQFRIVLAICVVVLTLCAIMLTMVISGGIAEMAGL